MQPCVSATANGRAGASRTATLLKAAQTDAHQINEARARRRCLFHGRRNDCGPGLGSFGPRHFILSSFGQPSLVLNQRHVLLPCGPSPACV